jgi:hypothetical protein
MTNPMDKQEYADNQAEKVNLTIIGDIVTDRITFDENEEKPKEYPGGSLFYKHFLQQDPAINSKANIYGYEEVENATETSDDHYSITIKEQVNTITLKLQDSKDAKRVYRSYGLTNTVSSSNEKNFNIKRPTKEQKKNFSILIVNDLGISHPPGQNQDGTDSQNQDGIANRKQWRESIKDGEPDSSLQFEWKRSLDTTYEANKKRDGYKDNAMPWHFITISNPSKTIFNNEIYTNILFNDTTEIMENEKMQDIRKHSLVILHGDHLRSGFNLAIARRISIERTAQDFLQELHSNPLLIQLGSFEHLIVKFGLLSVVHSYRINNRRFHRLFFDPKNIYDPIYSNKVSGVVTGNQTILLDNIIRQLLKLKPEEQKNPFYISERIGVGIKLGIKDGLKHYDEGYGSSAKDALKFLDTESTEPNCTKLAFVPKYFYLEAKGEGEGEDIKRKEVGTLEEEEKKALEIADERIPIAHPAWSILTQSAEYKLVQLAENIVFKGVDQAVNSTSSKLKATPFWSPIGRFGKKGELIVMERYELESYRSVQLLMEEAMTLENKAILSLAVFGPPGSGKSFVSERIANSACEASQVTPVVKKINLASVSESYPLSEKLDKAFSDYVQYYEFAKSESEENRKKQKSLQLILFFDEFDCSLNDKSLGWLKTFLPMMQDGEFTTTNNTYKPNFSTYHHQPILIFAGGTSHTYSNFSRQDALGDPEDRLRFAQAKGPDFVSRLRGHIDILGPQKTNELDEGYVIRRAILLRMMFLRRINQFTEYTDQDGLKKSLARPLVRAMLTVSNYKHGARSMEAIVAMCAKLPGDMIGLASIPPHAQLNMHVDANEFLKLVHSSRYDL